MENDIKMKTNVIYNKSCLFMSEVDDNSVDTIITSCPYWGLRDYGAEANQIWGGNPKCKHQWGDKLVVRERGSVMGITAQVGNQRNPEIAKTHSTRGQFCQLCEAWYGQLGLEPTLEMYIEHLLLITAECKRVLKPTGVLWWNHGDCYGGSGCGKGDYRNNNKRSASNPMLYANKPNPQLNLPAKCLCLQNYRLILRLIDEQGWILRNSVIWNKPNGMPSSVKDRLANKYEPVFMLVKNKKYWFDLDAIREKHKYSKCWGDAHKKGRNVKEALDARGIVGGNLRTEQGFYVAGKNPGDVWTIPTQPYPKAHFATFPEKLIIKPILSSCPEGGIILDPFAGSGTTLAMAKRYNRQYIGYEINKEYIPLIQKRLAKEDTLFNRGE